MSLQGQEDRLTHDRQAAPLQVASVTLTVRDITRVADFYQATIGLAVIGQTADAVQLGAGDAVLVELLHRPDALADDPAAAGLFHTAFLLPTRADLGRWLAHGRAQGVRLQGSADHLVSEAVYLSDPEGNGIEIYADRPSEDWHWRDTPQGPRVEMANAPLDIRGLLAGVTTPWDGAPGGTRVGHVHLRVGDIAQALEFYVGRLGFAVTRQGPEAAFLSTGGYHHHLAANIWQSEGAGARDAARAGLAWITLQATDAVPASLGGGELHDPWGTRFAIMNAIPA